MNEAANMTQYLTFTLEKDEFALEVVRVREVMDYTHITKVPRMPEHLCGVINLRGTVVSVVDLRLKLGMEAVRKSENTCIVVVEVRIDGEMLQVGILADSVQEVIDLDDEHISPPPRIGTKLNTHFIRGMGNRGADDFVIILDMDKVLADSCTGAVMSSDDVSAEEHQNVTLLQK